MCFDYKTQSAALKSENSERSHGTQEGSTIFHFEREKNNRMSRGIRYNLTFLLYVVPINPCIPCY